MIWSYLVDVVQKSDGEMQMAPQKTKAPTRSMLTAFGTIHFPQFLPTNHQIHWPF